MRTRAAGKNAVHARFTVAPAGASTAFALPVALLGALVVTGCSYQQADVLDEADSLEEAPRLPAAPPARTAAPQGTFGGTTTPAAAAAAPSPASNVGPTPVTPTPPPAYVPPSNPNVPPTYPTASSPQDPYAAAREFCAQRINQYRASIGRQPLQRVPSAEACVDQQTQSDAQTGTAHGAFATCNEFAQNECPGWPGPLSNVLPQCLESMWNEGPGGGHYENMASAQYRYVACGFTQTANGSWWIIQDFR